jgi:hypothetical protein
MSCRHFHPEAQETIANEYYLGKNNYRTTARFT